MTISPAARKKAHIELGLAREFQTLFWKHLGQLEKTLNVDIDQTLDLEDATLDELITEGRWLVYLDGRYVGSIWRRDAGYQYKPIHGDWFHTLDECKRSLEGRLL